MCLWLPSPGAPSSSVDCSLPRKVVEPPCLDQPPLSVLSTHISTEPVMEGSRPACFSTSATLTLLEDLFSSELCLTIIPSQFSRPRSVWQDLPSWNVEFSQIFPQFSLQSINRLERLFINQLKWDLYISSSLYAKYYFALRSLYEQVGSSLFFAVLLRRRTRVVSMGVSRF